MSNVPTRFSLLGIIGGLMVSENLGDVHDEVDHLCDLAGTPPLGPMPEPGGLPEPRCAK